jgi:glycosyltransferase involved in cell wall biosynthesis
MKIILINPYGPLPNEGWRKYRNILLGETLAQQNHDVIWYTSKFSHHFKKKREDVYQTGFDNFEVRLINSKGYEKNISLNRLFFEITFCWNLFFKIGRDVDLIIAADPSQFVGFLAKRLAKKHDAKLILDFMDEWPELFEKALPISQRKYVTIFVKLFKKLRRSNYNKADGIIALGKNYLNIAKSISKVGTPYALIYNGVDVIKMREWGQDEMNDIKGVSEQLVNGSLKCVYAGSLGIQGNNYDIKSMVAAAIFFKNKDVDFYIAGSGKGEEYIADQIEKHNLKNVFYLGNLSAEKLARLYSFCDIGLAVYGKGSNVDMPDKFYDYTSCGLVVLSSLSGELKDVIEANNLGYYYEAGNSNALIEKINILKNDRNLLSELKLNSEKIGMVFNEEEQYKKIVTLVNEIC